MKEKVVVIKVDNDGETPLDLASYNGYKEIVSDLISAGADVNKSDNDGMTPLEQASYKGHKEIVSDRRL